MPTFSFNSQNTIGSTVKVIDDHYYYFDIDEYEITFDGPEVPRDPNAIYDGYGFTYNLKDLVGTVVSVSLEYLEDEDENVLDEIDEDYYYYEVNFLLTNVPNGIGNISIQTNIPLSYVSIIKSGKDTGFKAFAKEHL